MADGVERETTLLFRGRIAKRERGPAMCHLVENDGDDQARYQDRGEKKRFGHAG